MRRLVGGGRSSGSAAPLTEPSVQLLELVRADARLLALADLEALVEAVLGAVPPGEAAQP